MFYAARNELQGNQLWDTDTLELKYRIWVAQYGIGDYPDTRTAGIFRRACDVAVYK